MAEIVNLNRARKARDRAAAGEKAAANRAAHGRTKAERARDAAAERERNVLLDGARLDGPATGKPAPEEPG
ncbi:DUF4169 family protein [Roseomonas nepalensis]|uniref:DUF4169 family protein n=2 Tax=Muricoccus nepalensis TaxID=1854500 RepID=A0A502G5R6_9PROT|nr:DUF4169 family protein [Roseomonas nepalensis]TPG57198.1 DUF4169 family protein [Roseomonas nepalensis]